VRGPLLVGRCLYKEQHAPCLRPVSGLTTGRPAFPRSMRSGASHGIGFHGWLDACMGRPAGTAVVVPLRGQRRLARPGGLRSLLPV